jgi:hypothetical protein
LNEAGSGVIWLLKALLAFHGRIRHAFGSIVLIPTKKPAPSALLCVTIGGCQRNRWLRCGIGMRLGHEARPGTVLLGYRVRFNTGLGGRM